VRPLLEFALKSCIQRCIVSDDVAADDGDAEARDDQMLSLRGRVAELLSVVADGICGVDAVMQVLIELKESSLEGCEAAWSMLPGVGTALYDVSSAQVDALLAGVDEAMRLGSGALRAAGAKQCWAAPGGCAATTSATCRRKCWRRRCRWLPTDARRRCRSASPGGGDLVLQLRTGAARVG
jgi:hypothetical protein